ncbi:tetratricopeptide repeat-containing sensor histidine kinase [Lacinutrix salivirga]
MKNLHHTLFVLVLFCVTSVFSQQKTIDSLQNIIDNYGTPDTTYVNLRSLCANKKLYTTPKDTTLLAYNFKTLEIADQLNYDKGKILAYQKIGTIYQYLQSNPYRAIDYYQKANTIIESNSKFKRFGLVTLGNIGNIYYNQQEYDKALIYYKKMLLVNSERPEAYNYIANTYGKTNKLDSATAYYKKAIKSAKLLKDNTIIANSYSNLADVQNRNGYTTEALKNIGESMALIKTHNITLIKAPTYANASSIYLTNKDYGKAESYAKEAILLNKTVKNLYTEMAAWKALTESYKANKKYKDAINAYENFVSLKDSISSTSRKIEVSRKEIKYQADKEQAIASAEVKRQKLIKNVSIGGGAAFILASFIGFMLYKKKRDASQKAEEANFKTKVVDTELKALRAQMNPHFIFNSLNSIGDYITKNDAKTATNYLAKFAKLMRQTLEHSEKKEILLSEDLAQIKNYLDIENKRFNNAFKYEIIIDETINPENTLVPPMLLQPFLENSIKHGFLTENEDINAIKISIKKENNILIFTLEDNGIGFKTDKKINNNVVNKNQSLGMKITKNRIDIINKQNNTNGSVNIINKEKGVKVEVTIPLQLAY